MLARVRDNFTITETAMFRAPVEQSIGLAVGQCHRIYDLLCLPGVVVAAVACHGQLDCGKNADSEVSPSGNCACARCRSSAFQAFSLALRSVLSFIVMAAQGGAG